MDSAPLQFRRATDEEVLAYYRPGQRVTFTHWVVETYYPRAKNGVRHKTKGTSRVYLLDGKAHVQYNGMLCKLFANHGTIPDTKITFICNPTVIPPKDIKDAQ